MYNVCSCLFFCQMQCNGESIIKDTFGIEEGLHVFVLSKIFECFLSMCMSVACTCLNIHLNWYHWLFLINILIIFNRAQYLVQHNIRFKEDPAIKCLVFYFKIFFFK